MADSLRVFPSGEFFRIPFYLTADLEAYEYFEQSGSEIFSEKEAFDGAHGMMVYNRTRQEKGRTTKLLPPGQWIVAVETIPA